MKLEDFQETQSSSIEDFQLQTTGSLFPINSVTASQLAASEAINGEEVSLERYRSIKENLMSPEARQEFLLHHARRQEESLNGIRQELSTVLSDPEIDDEEKQVFVFGAQELETRTGSTVQDLMEAAVIGESTPRETEQEADARSKFIDMIEESHRIKRDLQASINGYAANRDQTTLDKAVDIVEILIPFTEWININQFANSMGVEEGTLMGGQKQALIDAMKKMPIDKRAELLGVMFSYIEAHGAVVLPDGNDIASLDLLEKMFLDGEYSDIERYADNVFSVLDVAGVFGAVAGFVTKGGKGVSKAKKAATLNETKPTSPSQVVKEVNPEKARVMHETVAQDDTGEAAEALYGTTKEEAMAKDLLPEPEINGDIMPHKVQQATPQFEEDVAIAAARNKDASSALTDAEFARVRERIAADLNDIEGMQLHGNSVTMKLQDNGFTRFSMMYRPTDAGFSSVEEALSKGKFAFRQYGLTDKDFVVLRRTPDGWARTDEVFEEMAATAREVQRERKKKIPEWAKETQYALSIDYEYKFRPQDLQSVDVLDTTRFFGIPVNLASRADVGFGKAGQGSITQHFIPPNELFDTRITGPAAVAVDNAAALKKLYTETFNGFSQAYAGLKADRRAKVRSYIEEANFEGLPFDPVDLKARGFNDNEVDILREWRRGNDTLYHSTNYDLVKTLQNRGYKVFVDEANDTKLIGKPLSRNSISSNTSYYDHATGEIKTAAESPQALDEFYEGGGTFVKLREPVQVDGEWVDVVKSIESPTGGYLRALGENEKVLSYRNGYYPVRYDASFYIQKVVTRPDGTTFTKTLASAKNKQDANDLVAKMKAADPDSNYDWIDVSADRTNDFSEEAWSLGVSSGLSAQKIRGQRLIDAASDLHQAGRSNLHDPLEAVSMQIQSLSQRVAMRDVLDTLKARWVETYADDLGIKPDRFGNVGFPSSVDQIKKSAGVDSQTVADARDLFNYVYHLENGYINTIDDGLKAAINGAAEALGSTGLRKAEDLGRAAGRVNPSSEAKGIVFNAYLALNPLRQLIIQGHQNVQLAAIAPGYLAGPIFSDYNKLRKALMGVEDAEGAEMLAELQRTGLLEAVDTNNMIRRELTKLADVTATQKAAALAGKPIEYSRRVGFDVAEQSVLVNAWLAQRHLMKKSGRKLTRRAYDEVHAKARAFTYSMNKAGEMPYNQNTMAVVAQFLQVPHKAVLQPFLSRDLTRQQKLQLLGFNTLMYGVPTGLTGYLYQNMEPGVVRDGLEHGFEDVLLTKSLSALTGEEQQIDWGDLAPANIAPLGDFFVSLATTNVGEIAANTPAGSLLMGQNPRLSDAVKTVARYFHVMDDYDDPALQTTLTDVATSFLSISSGYSNAFKARYAYQVGDKISSSGTISDEDVTKFEAAMQAAGFRTKLENARFKIQQDLYDGASFKDSDVSQWYSELKRQITRRGQSPMEIDTAARIMAEGMRVFGTDKIKFQQQLLRLIERDAKRGEYTFIQGLMNQAGILDSNELRNLIEKLPEDRVKQDLRGWLDELERVQ